MPRHVHRYSKFKNYLGMMMLIWKQQQAIFEVQFMGKLSNIKALLIKKACICFAWNISRNGREVHSELSQTFKMELFAKIVNDWKLLTIFGKNSILDVWLGTY